MLLHPSGFIVLIIYLKFNEFYDIWFVLNLRGRSQYDFTFTVVIKDASSFLMAHVLHSCRGVDNIKVF